MNTKTKVQIPLEKKNISKYEENSKWEVTNQKAISKLKTH